MVNFGETFFKKAKKIRENRIRYGTHDEHDVLILEYKDTIISSFI